STSNHSSTVSRLSSIHFWAVYSSIILFKKCYRQTLLWASSSIHLKDNNLKVVSLCKVFIHFKILGECVLLLYSFRCLLFFETFFKHCFKLFDRKCCIIRCSYNNTISCCNR